MKIKDGEDRQPCLLCEKLVKINDKTKYVQLLTDGHIINDDKIYSNSQGFFPVGSCCYKKLKLTWSSNVYI